MACLPAKWFIRDANVPRLVPIFLRNIQSAVAEGIHVLAGHPPLSDAESLESSRRLRQSQVAALSVLLPGVTATKRLQMLAIAQDLLANIEAVITEQA